MVDPWQVITLEELAKHNDVENNNAWMCVRGVVYNVGPYAVKHPGGFEKIQKYAGKDATEVFNMVHSYVDVDEILDGFRVGILKGHPTAPKRGIFGKMFDTCCCLAGYSAPTTYFKQDSIVGTYVVEFNRSGPEADWTIGIKDKLYLQVFKRIDKRRAWYSMYELPETLENDQLTIEFNHKYEHCEITLRKPVPTTIWGKQGHGLKDCGKFVSIHDAYVHYDAFILFKKCLTSNVLMFAIQVCGSARINVPTGFHVKLSIQGEGKPYTPVLATLSNLEPEKPVRNQIRNRSNPITILYFMIKIYSEGSFTKKLDNIEIDVGNEVPTLQVSNPYGYFDPAFLHDFTRLILCSAGTGITPMIKIIGHFININIKMGGRYVILMFFCQTEHDLTWRPQFLELEQKFKWFRYQPVLTKPTEHEHWQGKTGHISDELVKSCLAGIRKQGLTKACICGPPKFNSAAVDALGGTVLSENIYVFSN